MATHQRLLEAARHMVRPVQHRHMVPGNAAGTTTLDLSDNAGSLALRVVKADDFAGSADGLGRMQSLTEQFLVLGDHRLGRREDVGG